MVTLCEDMCPQKQRKSETIDNPYEQFTPWDQDSGDSPGDRKGIKCASRSRIKAWGTEFQRE